MTAHRITTLATLIAGAVLVTACSGASSATPTLSEAFCNDLNGGMTLMNLWPRDQDPAEFASESYGRMAISCPELLEANRAFFENWGINIDA